MVKKISPPRNSKTLLARTINIPGGVPFSEFDNRGNIKVTDIIVGLRADENSQFSLGSGILDDNDNYIIGYESVGNDAANYLNFVNAETGDAPTIAPVGQDGNIAITIQSKNNAPINLLTQNNYINLNNTSPLYGFTTDGTFTDASNLYAPSAFAVKTYVDDSSAALANLTYITNIDETELLPNSHQLLGTSNQIDVNDGVVSLPEDLVLPGTLTVNDDVNINTFKITKNIGGQTLLTTVSSGGAYVGDLNIRPSFDDYSSIYIDSGTDINIIAGHNNDGGSILITTKSTDAPIVIGSTFTSVKLYLNRIHVPNGLTDVPSNGGVCIITPHAGPAIFGVESYASLNDGQILIGSDSGPPSAANLIEGDGITITNGANSITITNDSPASSITGTANQINVTDGVLSLAEDLILPGTINLNGHDIKSTSGQNIRIAPGNPALDWVDLQSKTVNVLESIIFNDDQLNNITYNHESNTFYFNANDNETLSLSASGLKIGGTGATITSISTDGTLGSDSDTLGVTEKAVKTYVDNKDYLTPPSATTALSANGDDLTGVVNNVYYPFVTPQAALDAIIAENNVALTLKVYAKEGDVGYPDCSITQFNGLTIQGQNTWSSLGNFDISNQGGTVGYYSQFLNIGFGDFTYTNFNNNKNFLTFDGCYCSNLSMDNDLSASAGINEGNFYNNMTIYGNISYLHSGYSIQTTNFIETYIKCLFYGDMEINGPHVRVVFIGCIDLPQITYLNGATPAQVFVIGGSYRFDVTVDAADLATGGSVILVPNVNRFGTTIKFKISNLWVNYGGTNFSGGGGDRLLSITDNTTDFSVIPAATLQALVNAGWGSTDIPYPASASLNTTANNLVAKYSGGTTDYTTGSVVISGVVEMVTQ